MQVRWVRLAMMIGDGGEGIRPMIRLIRHGRVVAAPSDAKESGRC